jgi:hypothetical protein
MSSIKNMPSDAKVWVYQSNRILSDVEVRAIEESGINFIAQWAAHGASLKASFDVLYDRFIVLSVDEKQATASGCSIDSSVRFVKQLEQQFNLNLFDRLQVAYVDDAEIKVCHLSEFEKLASANLVNASTVVFNNMITTIADFETGWKVALKDSWQSRVLK